MAEAGLIELQLAELKDSALIILSAVVVCCCESGCMGMPSRVRSRPQRRSCVPPHETTQQPPPIFFAFAGSGAPAAHERGNGSTSVETHNDGVSLLATHGLAWPTVSVKNAHKLHSQHNKNTRLDSTSRRH